MRKWTAALTVTLVVAAGCGGGEDGNGAESAGDRAEVTVSVPDDSSTDDSSTDDSSTDDSSTDDSSTDDSNAGGAAGGPYCDTVTRVMGDFTAVEQADEDAMFDPTTFEAMFGGVLDALDAMEASAPDEIADDFGVLSEAYRDVVGLFEAADWDIMSLMSDPEANAALEVLDSDEVTTAIDNIEDYTLEACGVDLGADGTESPDTMAPDDTVAPGGSGTGDIGVEMAAGLLQSMFDLTDEQAYCLAEKSSAAGIDASDVSALTAILGECGIAPEDLMGGVGN